MCEFRWQLLSAEDGEVGRTDPFGSREEAEAWMGTEWETLLEEGAEEVVLLSGERKLYRMGLRP